MDWLPQWSLGIDFKQRCTLYIDIFSWDRWLILFVRLAGLGKHVHQMDKSKFLGISLLVGVRGYVDVHRCGCANVFLGVCVSVSLSVCVCVCVCVGG